VREDDSDLVPHHALKALAQLGPLAVAAVDDLVQVHKARSPDLPPVDTFLVVEVLSRMGPDAIPRLVFHLRSSPRDAADPDGFGYEDQIGTAGPASAALRLMGEASVQPLVGALGDSERRADALLTLRSLGLVAVAATPALVRLYHTDVAERPLIITVLVAMGGEACAAKDLLRSVVRAPETTALDRTRIERALAGLSACR
jgi:hypothetical protein